MKLCLDCSYIFEEPKEYSDNTEFWGAPKTKYYLGCPMCSGTYSKTYQCDSCGEWITGSYIYLSDGTMICDKCCTEKDIQEDEF